MFFDKIFQGNVHFQRQQEREDRKLVAARYFEAERRNRIFNGKARMIGIDRVALDTQMAEKDKQHQIEKECDAKYEQAVKENAGKMLYKEVQEDRQRRRQMEELNYFRKTSQRPELRDSFELNDPDLLKKSLPVRIADDDIALTISSAQIFDGEDLGREERLRLQKRQTSEWFTRQIADDRSSKHAEQVANLMIKSSMCSQDRRLKELEEAERKMRQREVRDLYEFNATLAEKKKCEREDEKREELADNLAEIYNMMTSDMLTENTEIGRSPMNPNKKLALGYRGMTPNELHEFRQAQHRQLLEERQRKKDEKVSDFQWYHYELNLKRLQGLKQTEFENQLKDKREDCARFNLELAEQKRMQKEHAQRDKTPSITDDFYSQFNKSTR